MRLLLFANRAAPGLLERASERARALAPICRGRKQERDEFVLAISHSRLQLLLLLAKSNRIRQIGPDDDELEWRPRIESRASGGGGGSQWAGLRESRRAFVSMRSALRANSAQPQSRRPEVASLKSPRRPASVRAPPPASHQARDARRRRQRRRAVTARPSHCSIRPAPRESAIASGPLRLSLARRAPRPPAPSGETTAGAVSLRLEARRR